MRNIFAFVLVLAGLACSIAFGGRYSLRPMEAGFWDASAVAVIRIDQFVAPAAGKTGRGDCQIDVTVLAVLQTSHLLPTRLHLPYVGPGDSDSELGKFMPAKGETYLILLRQRWNDGQWYLPIHAVDLFESGIPVQKVRDTDDRLVARAEKRIEWMRKHSQAKQYQSEAVRNAVASEPDPAPPRPK